MAGQPACWARWTNASPIDHRRVGYSWNQMGAPRAEVAASIEVVATVESICKWLALLAALATATSASG